MSVLAYSTCRVQFTLNNKQNPEREYSDRTVVELRLSDSSGASIRAVDVESAKTEIFNFPIKSRNQYQFGSARNQPDQISDSNGTYRLWLNAESRDEFHQTFCGILEAFFPENSHETTSSSYTDSYQTTSPSYTDSYQTTSSSYTNSFTEKPTSLSTTSYSASPKATRPSTRDPTNCNAKDILTDVRNLSKFIQQGRADDAVRLTKRFISQGIHLDAKSLHQYPNEQEFLINIQLDGNEYNINQNGGIIPMYVFPSTTVRELRAAFEVAYQYPPPNQYFFVNGNIAPDDSTMQDLKVGPNSLFVLFLLAYTKQFKAQGPWKCSVCFSQNDQDDIRCRICLASRME